MHAYERIRVQYTLKIMIYYTSSVSSLIGATGFWPRCIIRQAFSCTLQIATSQLLMIGVGKCMSLLLGTHVGRRRLSVRMTLNVTGGYNELC